MKTHDRDLIVVGGGPAGLAAAIGAAAQGMRVTVLERREGVIDKACGEGLMPAAIAGLEALGVTGLRGHPFTGVTWADAVDPEQTATGTFPHGAVGRGVRRAVLHEQLRSHASRAGVAIDESTRVREIHARRDHVHAAGLTAPYLIAADGLHSGLRRQLGVELPSRHRRRFGVRRHFACAPWSDRVVVYWAEHAEAYVTPVAPDTVGVAFLCEPPADYDTLLRSFPLLQHQLAGARPVTPVRGAGPFEQRVSRRVVGRVLLVGDAAGYLDPLTGEGVALGVTTARAAVAAIVDGEPWRYERDYRRETRSYFALTGLLLRIAHTPWLRRHLVTAAHHGGWLFDRALGWLGGATTDSEAPGSRTGARLARSPGSRRAGAPALG